MASLMNGLSALGTGVAGFAATAGLEQQKTDAAQALQASGGVIQGNLLAQKSAAEADLARQADAMARATGSFGRQEAAGIAAGAAATENTYKTTAASAAAQVAADAAAKEQAAQLQRTKTTANAHTP